MHIVDKGLSVLSGDVDGKLNLLATFTISFEKIWAAARSPDKEDMVLLLLEELARRLQLPIDLLQVLMSGADEMLQSSLQDKPWAADITTLYKKALLRLVPQASSQGLAMFEEEFNAVPERSVQEVQLVLRHVFERLLGVAGRKTLVCDVTETILCEALQVAPVASSAHAPA